LGEFNAMNILACIHVASVFMSLDEIKKAVANLSGVNHRLQRIYAGGKLIIDDSFNDYQSISIGYILHAESRIANLISLLKKYDTFDFSILHY
jgi:UDP-N-acetylmuramyl pentapeptide synthase